MSKITFKDTGNVCSLAIIQASNALFPFLAFPYLLKKLGADAYSVFVVAEVISLYVLIVCIYSFDISGIKLIAEAEKISKKNSLTVFINIFTARLLLYFISISLIIPIIYLYKKDDFLVFLIWLIFPLGMIFQSNYYFQSIEKNSPLAVFVFISRLIAIVLVYNFVHTEKDVLIAASVLAGSFVFSGILSILFLLKNVGARVFSFISYKLIIEMICDGRHLFVGNASVALFRGANVRILAGVSSPTSVAFYSVAEKIIKSLQALARPLNQLFVPKVMQSWARLKEIHKTRAMAFKIVWMNTKFQIFMMILVVPMAIFFIDCLNKYEILFKFDQVVIVILMILAPAVFFGVANAMFGAVGLSLIHAQSYFAVAVFIVGISMFLLSILLSYFFNAYGAAISFVVGEIMLFIAFVWRYKGALTHG